MYESGECPDHGKHLVFIGQDGLGTVAARVGHLDATLPHLGDELLYYLHLHGAFAVGAAILHEHLTGAA